MQVLTRVRPPSAAQRIESIIGSEQFRSANRAVRTDLCVAYARLGAIRAQTRLEDLLSVRIGILRDESAIDTVYAAAYALADLGSPNARAALEKGSRSLASARRAACTEALAIMDMEA
jgi:transposase